MNRSLIMHITKVMFCLLTVTAIDTLHASAPAEKVIIHGAGVLPFAINPKDGKVYFLLGKEKSGKAAGTWADFGGEADAKDHNDPINTAAREFWEESEGLFGDYAATRRLVQRGKILSRSRDLTNVNYLVEVPYEHNISSRFPARHEKSTIAWISAEQLLNALNTDNQFIGDKRLRETTFRAYKRYETKAKLQALRDRFEKVASAGSKAVAAGKAPAASAAAGKASSAAACAAKAPEWTEMHAEVAGFIRTGDYSQAAIYIEQMGLDRNAKDPKTRPPESLISIADEVLARSGSGLTSNASWRRLMRALGQ